MNASLQRCLPETIHQTLTSYLGTWLVWCDSRGNWLQWSDGMHVAAAPLQAAGLLADDVPNKKDLPKPSADRARWRSDERRWVRAGKLPRCGWMDDSVPESPSWTELAPEREAERVRLDAKRQAIAAGCGTAKDQSRSALP